MSACVTACLPSPRPPSMGARISPPTCPGGPPPRRHRGGLPSTSVPSSRCRRVAAARWDAAGTRPGPHSVVYLILSYRPRGGAGPGAYVVPTRGCCAPQLEQSTKVLDVRIHSPLCPSAVETHLGTVKGKFARTCAAMEAPADTQCTHALMRSCPCPAEVEYALHTLPLCHMAAFAVDVTATQRATWAAVGRCGPHAHVIRGVGAVHSAAERGQLRGCHCVRRGTSPTAGGHPSTASPGQLALLC